MHCLTIVPLQKFERISERVEVQYCLGGSHSEFWVDRVRKLNKYWELTEDLW